MKAITIYCASSPAAPAEFVDAAEELGSLCAEAGVATVTGAGSNGLMGAVVRGTLSGGGHAIGVIPEFMVERGWKNPLMSEVHVTADMHERKRMLADLGCGAIALPGGVGTMDELMDLMAAKQLGLYDHPIVMLNINGFWDGILAQMAHADSCSMMRHSAMNESLWAVAETPAQAVEIILGKR